MDRTPGHKTYQDLCSTTHSKNPCQTRLIVHAVPDLALYTQRYTSSDLPNLCLILVSKPKSINQSSLAHAPGSNLKATERQGPQLGSHYQGESLLQYSILHAGYRTLERLLNADQTLQPLFIS